MKYEVFGLGSSCTRSLFICADVILPRSYLRALPRLPRPGRKGRADVVHLTPSMISCTGTDEGHQ